MKEEPTRTARSRTQIGLLVLLVAGVLGAVQLLLRGGGDLADDSPKDGRDDSARSESPAPSLADVAPAADHARTLASAALPPVDLAACDRELDLFGIVVDPNGAPIAGAEVRTAMFPSQRTSLLDVNSPYDVVLGPKTLSAVDGTFSLRLLRGACVNLTASHVDFATTTLPKRQSGERVRIVLHPATRLVIECLDESGAPVAEVKIKLWRITTSSFDHRNAVSGANGGATFDDLAPGAIRAQLDHAVLGQPNWQTIQIEAGVTQVHRVTLPTGRSIHGRVTDRATGDPIAGARVGSNWVCDRAVRTDADGRFVFPGWTGIGTDEMTALAQGYGRKTLTLTDQNQLDFVLEKGDRVVGRIVGGDGTPVAEARVHALASAMSGESQQIDSVAGRSREDGTFELEGLRRDLGHTLVVIAPGFGRYLLDFLASPGGPGAIDLGEIVLPSARSIRGFALDAAGGPLAEARVSLSGHNADRHRLVGAIKTMDDFYGRTESRGTDDLGRFRFIDLAPGTYSLELRVDGQPNVRREVILPASMDLEGVTLRLEAGDDLRVRVVDEAGAPIVGAYVNSQEPYVSAKTDSAGLAVLRGLPAVDTWLSGMLPSSDLEMDPFVGRPGGAEVRVVAYATVAIEGTVVDEEGSPLEGVQVVTSGSKTSFLPLTGPSGNFYLNAKRGETFDLSIAGRTVFATRGEPSVATDSRLRGTLRGIVAPASGLVLAAKEGVFDRTLSVLVVDPEDRPVGNASVFLHRADATVDLSGTSDAAGRVTFRSLEAGDYLATAHSPSPDWVESEPTPIATDSAPAIVRLRRGQLVAGVVLDSNGAAVARAAISTRRSDRSQQGFRADEFGRFRFLVPQGLTVSLEVTHSLPNGARERGVISDVVPGGGEITIRTSR